VGIVRIKNPKQEVVDITLKIVSKSNSLQIDFEGSGKDFKDLIKKTIESLSDDIKIESRLFIRVEEVKDGVTEPSE